MFYFFLWFATLTVASGGQKKLEHIFLNIKVFAKKRRDTIKRVSFASIFFIIALFPYSVSAQASTFEDNQSITIAQLFNTSNFTKLWHPTWIGITAILLIAYLLATGPLKSRFGIKEEVRYSKKIWFIFGLVILYVKLGSPLRLISSYSFSAHMLGMSLYYLVMPPFILAGLPSDLVRSILGFKGAKKLVSFFTRPWIIVVVFNALLSFYHFPLVFDFFFHHMLLATIAQTLILISAFGMWWNIICPVPEKERLSDALKLVYIALNVVILYPSCVLIAFSSSIIYGAYDSTPQLFNFLPPLEDQRGGGVIMNVTQEIALGLIIIPIVFRWVKKNKENEKKLDEKLAQEVAQRFSRNSKE